MIEIKENSKELVKRAKQVLDKEKVYKNIEDIDYKINSNFGIVYIIYVNEKPVYIGKSKGKYFKTRLSSHFKGVGVKTGTKSKYNKIKGSKNVTLKFLKTNPCALRNLIEELLIDDFKMNHELWNFKK